MKGSHRRQNQFYCRTQSPKIAKSNQTKKDCELFEYAQNLDLLHMGMLMKELSVG